MHPFPRLHPVHRSRSALCLIALLLFLPIVHTTGQPATPTAAPAPPKVAEPGRGLPAILTLTTGERLAVDAFTLDGATGTVVIGTATRSIGRAELRDISFTGRQAATNELATGVADLKAWKERALKMLERFPDCSSILLLDEGEYTYRPDGTNVAKYRGVVYIAKDEALGQGDLTLGFDPNRERITVHHARCLDPDGRLHTLAPDQIKISKGSSGGVFFDQNQELSFSIPGVTVGAVIDYSYETETYNPFDRNFFQSFFFFQGDEPVGDSILRVRMPADKPLYYLAPNCPPDKAKPVITKEGDTTVYTWTMTDMPPIIPEPYMPPRRDILPGVVFCLQKDWDYFFNRLRPMFEKRFQLTDLVKKKVDEIVEGARDIHEKIARLYLFCQKEIRYISIKGNLASNQVGHPAEETLKNRYGDCTDKGMLLATMLKHIGVEAYPVGIRTNTAGRAIRELPIFDANHCITQVRLDGRIFYLDSTATDYRYPYFRDDDHDTICDNPMKGELASVPLPPPEDNQTQIERILTLRPDGTLEVDYRSTMNGTSEAGSRYSIRNMKPEEYVREVKQAIAGLTADYELLVASHSDPLDFSGPFTVFSKYILNRYAPRSGSYMVFEIPFFRMRFGEVSLEKRTYDIVYTTTKSRIENITINLPPGFAVKYLPPPLRIKSPYVEFEVTYDQKEGQILLRRTLAFPRRIIPVAEYASYKADLERIARASDERIFLEEERTGKEASR